MPTSPPSESANRGMRTRIATVSALFAIGFGILLCRAFVFHLAPNAKLEKVALRQYRTAVRESTRRGKIVDAVGRELAINVQAESLYANPRAITNPRETASRLARILKLQRSRLEERLSSKRKFEWIKRRLTSKEVLAVKALGLPGVFTMHESKRAYPNGELASTILGAVGLDAEGLAGIELVYDDILISRSSPGRYARDARGHLYLSPTDVESERRLAEIQLTVDQTLQYIAETGLESGVKSSFARGGVVVVVDPSTGAVLAMASTPKFDRNRAVTDSFEPGSTFKAMVIAAALDDLRVTPEQIFDCEGGEMRIGSDVIHDTHPHGTLSVADIVKVSSNIGAAKIARTFSRQELQAIMARFGFGRPLGIELPGEASGILPRTSSWSELTQATVGFGQGISATPLQMTMAFAAIANGGELLRPGLVKRVIDANGEEIKSFERQVLSRPIKPETARLMTHLLEVVVKEEGTGTLAASPEYRIAGKTGTAQKVDPNLGVYADGKYYSSFIGFAPSDDPQIIVYVGIDEPAGAYYGGQVAAPVFRKIVEASLHYMKVPTHLSSAAVAKSFRTGVEEPGMVSSGTARVVPAGKTAWRIPDFRGLTMRAVLEATAGAPLSMGLKGSGVAVEQNPPPGSVVSSGARCDVTFRSML